MSEKRYFKVLGASHQEGERNFAKGKIVETERDLVAMFGANKFRETTKKGRPLHVEDEDEDEVTDLENDEDKPASKKSSKETKKATDAGDSKGETPQSDAESNAPEYESIQSKLGEDVSEQFGGVKLMEQSLAVVHKGKEYHVVDRDTPDGALNGDAKLTSKAKVQEFLDEYLK